MTQADISYLLSGMLQLPALIVQQFFLLSTNSNKGNIYCDLSGKIFHILNKISTGVPVSTSHHNPNYHFLYLKNCNTLWWIPPEHYSITQNWVKKGTVNHFQCWLRHMWFNNSNYITSSAHFFFVRYSVWLLQVHVLSNIMPRNLVWEILEINLSL